MQKNKKFLLPIITAISILFSGYIPVMADVDLSTIPAYTGEPYVEINVYKRKTKVALSEKAGKMPAF